MNFHKTLLEALAASPETSKIGSLEKTLKDLERDNSPTWLWTIMLLQKVLLDI